MGAAEVVGDRRGHKMSENRITIRTRPSSARSSALAPQDHHREAQVMAMLSRAGADSAGRPNEPRGTADIGQSLLLPREGAAIAESSMFIAGSARCPSEEDPFGPGEPGAMAQSSVFFCRSHCQLPARFHPFRDCVAPFRPVSK